MIYRKLGQTGLSVSEIGFGTWAIGGITPGPTSYGKTDDKISVAALERAFECGINIFDTSNLYGYGHSELLLGSVFSGLRDQVIIATKAGFIDYNSPPNFTIQNIENSIEKSLKRLKTNYIDLLQLHNPSLGDLNQNPRTFEYLMRLKNNGVIKAIGLSAKNPSEAIEILEFYPFEVIQVNFNLLDIRVIQSGLFNIIKNKNLGFISRTPLAFGFLTGKFTSDTIFPIEDQRSRWSSEQIKIWLKGADILLSNCEESFFDSPSNVALRFCLSYPEVSTTIAGMINKKEVLENVNASNSGPLTTLSLINVENIHSEIDFFI